MSRIDGNSPLAALIRAQMLATHHENGVSRLLEGKQGLKKDAKNPAPDLSGSETFLSERLKGIRMDDPQRHAKAFRFFLQAVLAKEFGMGGQPTDEFDRLIEQVLLRMTEDKAVHDLSITAAEKLLKNAHLPL